MEGMRLFVSLLPDEDTIGKLVKIQDKMKKNGIRGRYTDPFNLHMTLLFIGEYGNPDQIMDILEEIPFEPFTLKLSSLMKMRDLYVCAFEENKALETYVKKLHKAFSDHGVPFDRKSFFAHITMLRKASDAYGLFNSSDIPQLITEADAVSLMHSKQGAHGMVYTEIGRVEYDEFEEFQDETNMVDSMADTKEMSRKWNLSIETITALCRAGMIPSAEKEKGRWQIPLDAPKPPCTAHMAMKYLRNIEMIQEGAPVAFSLYRKSTAELVDSFEYLKAIGFLSDFRWKSTAGNEIDFEESLGKVRLTTAAKEFIETMRAKTAEQDESSLDISIGGKLGGGAVPAEVSGTLKYSSKNRK